MIKRIVSTPGFLSQILVLSAFMSPGQVIALKRKPRYQAGEVKTRIGVIEYVDAKSFLSGVKEIFIDEIYRFGGDRPPPAVVLDCGANIGLSALYFAQVYGARVHAVEADPAIYEVLQRNVDRVEASGSVEVQHAAVWIDNEGVVFDIEGGYSGQIHKHGHQLVKQSVRVPSVRLRDLVANTENVNFLKLDIEGAENEALLDCAGVLNKLDYIFIEWHSIVKDPQYLGEILNLLKQEGFRYHIQEAYTSSHPFVELREMCGMDLQLNVFAYK